jgi:hypothetical protein
MEIWKKHVMAYTLLMLMLIISMILPSSVSLIVCNELKLSLLLIETCLNKHNVCPYCSMCNITDLDSSEPEMAQLYNLTSPTARSLSHYRVLQ